MLWKFSLSHTNTLFTLSPFFPPPDIHIPNPISRPLDPLPFKILWGFTKKYPMGMRFKEKRKSEKGVNVLFDGRWVYNSKTISSFSPLYNHSKHRHLPLNIFTLQLLFSIIITVCIFIDFLASNPSPHPLAFFFEFEFKQPTVGHAP